MLAGITFYFNIFAFGDQLTPGSTSTGKFIAASGVYNTGDPSNPIKLSDVQALQSYGKVNINLLTCYGLIISWLN
jgi:hypothetical protein